MSTARNLRRLSGKKTASDLASAIHAVKAMTGGLQAVLPAAEREVTAAQDILAEFRSGLADFTYMLERQRAVFIRLLNNAVVGGNVQELLALEAEYGAEYDALQAFCFWMVTLETL